MAVIILTRRKGLKVAFVEPARSFNRLVHPLLLPVKVLVSVARGLALFVELNRITLVLPQLLEIRDG